MQHNEPAFPGTCSFVTVEGVVGVGKTSLCTLLAERWNARLVLEALDDNPFLPRFYHDRKSWAFQTQMWFLLSRYRQLGEAVSQQDLFHAVTVSDYMFAKDRIFASINLDDDELQLYNHVANILETQVPRADQVVYLQASTDVLLKRIVRRGRSYESNMDPSYLAQLNEAYNHYFFHYEQSPLLVINTDGIDFVNNEADYTEIVEQIEKARPGVTWYQPMGTRDKAAWRGRR
ncbi:MAG: deoxynucleoside kinase [Chitinispirillaceae bacterium]|nr:deoxynucleoside kinase [Chitinispirillaceae bacterium]